MDAKTKAETMREALEKTAASFDTDGMPDVGRRCREAFAGLPDESAARLLDICQSVFREKNKQPNELLDDLSQHLAYHASIGFAECRNVAPPDQPVPEWTGRTEDMDREFTVTHQDRQFCVTVEEVE